MAVEVVILAGGKGSRMNSKVPKVMHQLGGRPLIDHVIQTAKQLSPLAVHTIVGYGRDVTAPYLSTQSVVHIQEQQLGTGHAVLQSASAWSHDSIILVLFGDVPLVRQSDLEALLQGCTDGPALLVAEVSNSTGYGRVKRNSNGEFIKVVEEKDASTDEKNITEVNTGVLACPASLLKELLLEVTPGNAQSEYYLPDVLLIARQRGLNVSLVQAASLDSVRGVNTRGQLAELERYYQQTYAHRLMEQGVSIADPQRIDVRGTLDCGVDVTIDVNVVFEGSVTLGDGVQIGPNVVIKNASIGSNSCIKAFSHLEDVLVAEQCHVGPYARLRPGTSLEAQVHVGNFVEVKNSSMGAGSKANHLAYVGDSTVGEQCNIGAGVITCNYDGVNKHRTTLGDRVFIGSNSTLVAPAVLGSDSFIAAGSTITKSVDDRELAVARSKQRNITGWQSPRAKKESE